MFDEEDFIEQTGATKDINGYITLPVNAALNYSIEVDENVVHTLSIISDNSNRFANLQVQFFNANLERVCESYMSTASSPYIPPVSGIKYISIKGAWTGRYTVMFKNFMIVEGSYTAETMPPYEPYKEPQTLNIYTPQILHGLGDVSDTVVLDFDNRRAELVQNVSFGKFTGNEDWYTLTQATDIQTYYLSTNIVKPNNIGERYTLSNIAVYGKRLNQKNQVAARGFKTGNGWVGYSVGINEYPTIEIFKMHLQEMNNSNTPVKIYVDCKNTPITTDISNLQDWDNMPDISGTIILTVDSTAEPNLNVSYYSTTKE